MIRTLTIVESIDGVGNVEYSLNGVLPVDEAAKILVMIAFNATPQTQSMKDEPIIGKPIVDKVVPDEHMTTVSSEITSSEITQS